MIHQRSKRADGPFVILNCAALRPERFEMELFGSEAGTDGPAKIGTFEQAHGGTLLLDEVADMPLETQGKIVRILQDQTFQRVGGKDKVSVDVRVIAASRRDVDQRIERGLFRSDLFHRLAGARLELPPLRERDGDVELLAGAFWSTLTREEPLPDTLAAPLGAQGVPLTPRRSIAVDVQSIPYGTPVWLDTSEPLTSTPQEFAARIDSEIANWRKVVKAANIKVE